MRKKNLSCFLTIVLAVTCFSQGLFAQEKKTKKENRVSTYSTVKNYNLSFLKTSGSDLDLEFDVVDKGKNFLLLIAVDKYKFWKPLSNAVKDAHDLRKVLIQRYGFDEKNIFELLNEEVTQESVREAFENLRKKGTNLDNLLIYFSGHGFYDPSFDLGYWVPSEGKTNKGAVSTYIPNDQIRNYIKSMEFKHIFLVADACFSGSLFISDSRGEKSEKMESVKSRWGLSSGNLELVSDGEKGKNSPFAHYLITYLKNNLKDRLKVKELVDYVIEQVKNNSEQEPLGNQLSGVGSEGGQFIFSLQGTKEGDESGNLKK